EALAGEKLHALALELPDATATNTPELASRFRALLTALLKPPPSDMFATAGLMWLAATQSMPAMTEELLPDPAQLSTFTPYSRTCLATPKLVPPTVPATWVPWPWQSVLDPPAKFTTCCARPPN